MHGAFAPDTPLHRPSTPGYTDSFDAQWAQIGGDAGGGFGGTSGFGDGGGYRSASTSDLGYDGPPGYSPGTPMHEEMPGTPMHEEAAVELLPENVMVKLKDGSRGTISMVLEGEAAYDVMLSEAVKTVRVGHAEVEVLQPGKKEKLVVISGEQKGSTGVLIGIDGLDGIVKMTTGGDIKILDLQSCAKLAS